MVSLNVLYRVPHEEQPVIIAAVIRSAAEHAGFLRAGRETEVKRVEFPADVGYHRNGVPAELQT